MFKDVKQITYRGSLKSCNYTCFYCPFSKKTTSKAELIIDEKRLQDFVNKLETTDFTNKIEIFFTPYGEALIHNYYKTTISELSKKSYISKVGCQTNLSFNVDNWLNFDTEFEKIHIWATFHPTMTSIDSFVEKVNKISKVHTITIGVVGNPEYLELIKELRNSLPTDVYMWINAMEGLNRAYSEEEINEFIQIDSNFKYEICKPSDTECNCAKEHIFVGSNGNMYGCNRNKNILGNIYKNNKIKPLLCTGKSCDCYLAYSHRKSFIKNSFIRNNNLFRNPDKIKPKIVFFDIDGTLTESRETLINVFDYISKKIPIYLATELPEEIALRKISFLKKFISGGVYAGGSYVVDYRNDLKKVEYIEKLTDKDINFIESGNVKAYFDDNKCYRLITSKNKSSIINKYGLENVDIVNQDSGMVSIVKKGCNKLTGIKIICDNINVELQDIMCVGNGENDVVMFENCGYSVSVLNCDIEVRKHSEYNLNVSHIPFIL